MAALMAKVPVLGDKFQGSDVYNGAGTFVVAYAVHKVFAPVRIATTLFCVPLVVRKLRIMKVLK